MKALLLAGDDGTAVLGAVRSALTEPALASEVAAASEAPASQAGASPPAEIWQAAAHALMRCSRVPLEARLSNLSQVLEWQGGHAVRARPTPAALL